MVVVVVDVRNNRELLEVSLIGRRVVVVVVVVDVVETVVLAVVDLVGAFVVAAGFLQRTLRAKSHESAALLKYKPEKEMVYYNYFKLL